jgi:hydroxyacylglutathione hydrolase
MTTPGLVPLVDEGLGNSTYLLDLGDGRALVVDPSRDVRAVRAAAERRGLRLAYVADTHLHADFISGARQLAATDGARVLASATGQREFEHTGLRDGDEIDLGGLTLQALATPGHTDEHLAFLLRDGTRAIGVFTGGSLIVGSAARTDLVAPERTEELARAQYRSLQRLAALDDDVEVWPTHGAGSFCSAPPGSARATTIGSERATNHLLRAPDAEAFVAALVDSLGSFPPYFLRLAEINRRGPTVLDAPPVPPALDVDTVQSMLADDVVVIDARPLAGFAERHIPGAIAIPLRAAFATWLGWLAPYDRPLVVVRDKDQDLEEIAWQATKVGYHLAGELSGGMAAWQDAGAPIAAVRLANAAELDGLTIVDVRQHAEFTAGHVPGARHLELGAVAGIAEQLPQQPTVVMCGHGERAMGAASLLARAGHRQVTVLSGGPEDWVAATGRSLQIGS